MTQTHRGIEVQSRKMKLNTCNRDDLRHGQDRLPLGVAYWQIPGLRQVTIVVIPLQGEASNTVLMFVPI